MHAERGFRRPRRPGGTPTGRRGAPRAALRSDALSPRPWLWSVPAQRAGGLGGAPLAPPSSMTTVAGFTPAQRAGGLGGAPLAPPSLMYDPAAMSSSRYRW